MKTLKIRIIICLLLLPNFFWAQETWSLEKCIGFAYGHNLGIEQSNLQIKSAKEGVKEANFSRYPSLSANSALGFNSGRAVNPSTNVFESSNANYNNFGINANVLLYNGGRLQQEYRRANVEASIANIELEQTYQTLSLQIIQAYFQVLLAEEQVEIANKQAIQSQNQLDKMDNLIRVGSVEMSARYAIQAQVARAEQQITAATANRDLGVSNLKNLMQMPSEQTFKLEKPRLVVPTANPFNTYSLKALYSAALLNQAQIKGSELQIESAKIGVKIAKASLQPSVFLQGNVASNYSNLITDETLSTVESTQEKTEIVKIDGRLAKITTSNPIVTMPIKNYGAQIQQNFNQSVSLTVSIPIFDGFARKTAVKRAQIRVEQKILQAQQGRILLQTEVQNALTAAKAAHKIYSTVQKIYDAQKVVYAAADNHFQVGRGNAYELAQAKSQLDISERDVVIAKYDYFFKLKIIDYYEGKITTSN